MAEKNKTIRHAMLFSGGGANAAYEVGVVKALVHEPSRLVSASPIEPDIFTGISIGALNAAVMAARADRGAKVAVDYLERLWRDRIASPSGVLGNGIFRFRLNPFQYLDPRTWLTSNPLLPLRNFTADALLLAQETLRRTAQLVSSDESFEESALRVSDLSSGIDFQPLAKLVREAIEIDKIPTSPARLRVTAANWESGQPEVFANEDLEGERGYEAIVAAAAIPGVVPSQRIRDTLFVAGAVLSGTPLVPAIRAASPTDGGERELVIHAVYFDPETARVPSSRAPSTLVSSIRLYTIAFSRSVNADLERARNVNERLAIRDTLAPDAKDHDAARVVLEDMASDLEGKIRLTVHRYRPSRASSEIFGLLQFDRERIEQQIEAGYHDARRHDCEEAGCIYPD